MDSRDDLEAPEMPYGFPGAAWSTLKLPLDSRGITVAHGCTFKYFGVSRCFTQGWLDPKNKVFHEKLHETVDAHRFPACCLRWLKGCLDGIASMSWDYSDFLCNLYSLLKKARDASPVRCHYSQSFRAQSSTFLHVVQLVADWVASGLFLKTPELMIVPEGNLYQVLHTGLCVVEWQNSKAVYRF